MVKIHNEEQPVTANSLGHKYTTVRNICQQYELDGRINRLYAQSSKLMILMDRIRYIKNMQRWKEHRASRVVMMKPHKWN